MVPPDIVADDDGTPIAVLTTDRVNSPHRAVRYIAEEHDWYLEDLPIVWTPDEEHCRPVLSHYRRLVESVKPSHMRPWREGDEYDSEWGSDMWLWCPSTDPDAVAYWELPA